MVLEGDITTGGFTCIGWQGFQVLVPEEWNVRLHDGNAKRGALVFADLRRPRLEVRWRLPRRRFLKRLSPQEDCRRALEVLRQRHRDARIKTFGSAAAAVTLAQGTLLLAADKNRVYELHWPAQPTMPEQRREDDHIDRVAEAFVHHLHHPAAGPGIFWSVYGASGPIPANARLKKVSLLPGASSLTFKDGAGWWRWGGTITLGSFSMADRLLARAGSLRQWATQSLPLIAANPAGTWDQGDSHHASFEAPTRLCLRRYRHSLKLTHDAHSNRITFTHHLAPERR